MKNVSELAIEVMYEKHSDGRYHIKGLNLPGLRLAGTNLRDLQHDLDIAVRDLLKHNSGFIVESLEWVPGPEETAEWLNRRHPEPNGKAIYVARTKSAA